MRLSGWPIIVGGCYRSGTSLVRRILNAHSRIHCGPEVTFFRDFYGDYYSDPLQHLRFTRSARALLPEAELLEILGTAFVTLHQHAARRHGKIRWADKNPENTRYLTQWQELLGDQWFFVHVIRDPLDTLASMKEIRFPLTLPDKLSFRIKLYLDCHQAALDFTERHSDRCIRVRYEKLVNNPQGELRSLMSRLGESAEFQQLHFNAMEHQIGLEDPKISSTQGIDATRVGQWRQALTDVEADEILSATAGLWNILEKEL